MKISFIFAWYDMWIGAFWDKRKKWLYILPLPCCGIILKFRPDNPPMKFMVHFNLSEELIKGLSSFEPNTTIKNNNESTEH